MDSRHITPDQAALVQRRISRDLAYVQKLVDRMVKLRFPADDALWLSAMRVHRALNELNGLLSYKARRVI